MGTMKFVSASHKFGVLAAFVLAMSGCTVTYSPPEDEAKQDMGSGISTPGIQVLGVTEQEQAEAETTASRVLGALDARRIDDFWNECTENFKAAYTRDAWAGKFEEFRRDIPEGYQRKRVMLVFHSNASSDSNESKGRYATFQNFLSCGNTSCNEQLTLEDVGGTWRIAGYHVNEGSRPSR